MNVLSEHVRLERYISSTQYRTGGANGDTYGSVLIAPESHGCNGENREHQHGSFRRYPIPGMCALWGFDRFHRQRRLLDPCCSSEFSFLRLLTEKMNLLVNIRGAVIYFPIEL